MKHAIRVVFHCDYCVYVEKNIGQENQLVIYWFGWKICKKSKYSVKIVLPLKAWMKKAAAAKKN